MAPTRSAASNWTTGSWQVGDPWRLGPPDLPWLTQPEHPLCSSPSSAQPVPPASGTPPCRPSSLCCPPPPLPAHPTWPSSQGFPAPGRAGGGADSAHTPGPLPAGLLAQRMFVMLPCGGVGVSVPRARARVATGSQTSSLPSSQAQPLPACSCGSAGPVGQGLSRSAPVPAGSSLWRACPPEGGVPSLTLRRHLVDVEEAQRAGPSPGLGLISLRERAGLQAALHPWSGLPGRGCGDASGVLGDPGLSLPRPSFPCSLSPCLGTSASWQCSPPLKRSLRKPNRACGGRGRRPGPGGKWELSLGGCVGAGQRPVHNFPFLATF